MFEVWAPWLWAMGAVVAGSPPPPMLSRDGVAMPGICGSVPGVRESAAVWPYAHTQLFLGGLLRFRLETEQHMLGLCRCFKRWL
jgi:hypothetical protein